MSANKHIDKICCAALALALFITFLLSNAQTLGVQAVSAALGYEARLFNTSAVHTIDIVMDDWESFLENCTDEKYVDCTVIIDGDICRNVGIRAKGNTSLSSVAGYGNDRYSFKIEFDHYDSANTYYGLDKLCLNNIIQDNTYMKDYLTYELMRSFDVDAPLCSYAYLTVNNKDWGLYLAVEAVEESFLQRCYGSGYGELYKPDSMDMGGGRGNGRDFDPEKFNGQDGFSPADQPDMPDRTESPDMTDAPGRPEVPDMADMPDRSEVPDMTDAPGRPELPDMTDMPNRPGLSDMTDWPKSSGMADTSENSPRMPGRFGSMGSSDVSLIYTDDEYNSYSNIFENAKTDITASDKDRLIFSLKKMNEGESIDTAVDTDAVIRYFVVHNFVLNFDSYTGAMIHNYYLYEKDGQLSMIPWDYNLAFGGFMSESDATALINYPIDTPVSGGTMDTRPMLAWIFDKEEYTEQYHRYFSEFISEYFDSGYFTEMIDTVSEMISPYVEKDATKFCTYEEFKEGVSTLKEFCLLRAQSIDGQLNGSIPSTSEEQTQNDSSLIDGSHLSISSMGSMGNQMAPGAPRIR
ncbi:MAG: CotH kinase family protein [Blautia sp.]|nr:CotH kinase family protein [Blautia sp.]MCM1199809.1 CotH kinase family protein [Bacteroides fragilis]